MGLFSTITVHFEFEAKFTDNVLVDIKQVNYRITDLTSKNRELDKIFKLTIKERIKRFFKL